jgi:hypothetical protein
MTSSLADLLDKSRFAQPREVQVIKDYLLATFQAQGQIAVTDRQIVITVQGAALAGALQPRLHELQEICATDKRLVIRIGN